jgi:hypothetical protein
MKFNVFIAALTLLGVVSEPATAQIKNGHEQDHLQRFLGV